MDFKDGFFKDDNSHKLELVRKIRKYRPDIVITKERDDTGNWNVIVTDFASNQMYQFH